MSDDDAVAHEIEASIGSLYLKVQGDDATAVSATFDEKLLFLLEESEEMAQAVRDGTRACQ